MATGDTIPGKLRVVRIDQEGNKSVVAGPYGSADLDDVNNQFTPEDYIYLNTMRSNFRSAPLSAREEAAPSAQYLSGEVLQIEFKANATVVNDVDYDFDAFTVDVVVGDRNRGRKRTDTLTVADQELTGDVAESADAYTAIYEFTVPDRQEYRLAGRLAAAAIEN